MLKMYTRYLTLAFLLIVMSGCASLKNLDLDRMFQSFSSDARQARINRIAAETDALLESGQPVAALKHLQNATGTGLKASEFPEVFPRTINHLIDRAGYHYAQENPVEAGMLFRMADTSYPSDFRLRNKILTDIETLRYNIDLCADKLLEVGLLAYRSGQLQEAIDVWSQIRTFHPEYQASRKAIRTTRMQMQILEEIKGESS